jgi:hypothetical protein
MNYGLSFIADKELFNHVRETVERYRFKIDLSDFNKNLVDPIKLTFDAKVYSRDIEEVVEDEIIRQLDKSNTNHIGYFHQNIFKHLGGSKWTVPDEGYDVVNEEENIYVEMKNKHNTMNSSSSQKTYMRMQNTLIHNPNATCLLVEAIAKNSQNIEWSTTVEKVKVSSPRIRRVSMDKFYEMVTGDKNAFRNLCQVIPKVIEDVVAKIKEEDIARTGEERQRLNTVLEELTDISPNLMKSLYLFTFNKYEGFEKFDV